MWLVGVFLGSVCTADSNDGWLVGRLRHSASVKKVNKYKLRQTHTQTNKTIMISTIIIQPLYAQFWDVEVGGAT